MDGVVLTPMKQIFHPKGDIFHGIKVSDEGFAGFGEAYFSTVNKDDIKGWKKHTQMTMNILVPIGEIEFVTYKEEQQEFFNVKLSSNNYYRLTVQPGIWMAFRGIGEYNMLLNVASMEHDPNEAINIELNEILYGW